MEEVEKVMKVLKVLKIVKVVEVVEVRPVNNEVHFRPLVREKNCSAVERWVWYWREPSRPLPAPEVSRLSTPGLRMLPG